MQRSRSKLKSLSRYAIVAGVLAAAVLSVTRLEPAHAYPAAVENACRADYFKHCASYPVGSASLRLCMESKSKDLSPNCVTALVDAGLVDRRRLRRGH